MKQCLVMQHVAFEDLGTETKRAGESAKETGQALLREWIDQW